MCPRVGDDDFFGGEATTVTTTTTTVMASETRIAGDEDLSQWLQIRKKKKNKLHQKMKTGGGESTLSVERTMHHTRARERTHTVFAPRARDHDVRREAGSANGLRW